MDDGGTLDGMFVGRRPGWVVGEIAGRAVDEGAEGFLGPTGATVGRSCGDGVECGENRDVGLVVAKAAKVGFRVGDGVVDEASG